MTKIEICMFVFSTLFKDCGTNRVDLAIELKKCIVNAFELLCLFLFIYICICGHFEPVPSLLKMYFHTS